MITQMIIAGSGYGTRMGDAINKRHTKSLIKVGGRYLLDVQLDWAIRSGINNFCISVKPEDQKIIDSICGKYSAIFTFRTGEATFQEVPSLFVDVLEDRFIFVGGHTPVLPTHLQKMIEAANYYRYVVSAYNNIYNAIPKKIRIIVDRNFSPEKYFLIYEDDVLPNNHYYLKNPYIVDRDIIESVKDNFFKKTPLFYIYKKWEKGCPVVSVDNEFPVEFNTNEEFYRTRDAIKKYFKII
jgi:GTP:adenosylcobinamide-phosphate guanylyltransferase